MAGTETPTLPQNVDDDDLGFHPVAVSSGRQSAQDDDGLGFKPVVDASNGPRNPYVLLEDPSAGITDMSKVAGATPGTPMPINAAGVRRSDLTPDTSNWRDEATRPEYHGDTNAGPLEQAKLAVRNTARGAATPILHPKDTLKSMLLQSAASPPEGVGGPAPGSDVQEMLERNQAAQSAEILKHPWESGEAFAGQTAAMYALSRGLGKVGGLGYDGIRGALRERLIGSPLRGVVNATEARAGALDAAIRNTKAPGAGLSPGTEHPEWPFPSPDEPDQPGGPSSPAGPNGGPAPAAPAARVAAPAPAEPAATPSQGGLVSGGTPTLDPALQDLIRESDRRAFASQQPPETTGTQAAGPATTTLEQEPGGTSTSLLDQIVAGHDDRLAGLRAEHGQSSPADIKALMDAIDEMGRQSHANGEIDLAGQQAGAATALEQLLEEAIENTKNRAAAPTPAQELEIGKAYIQSVLAGIAPPAAAAALGMTPEQQETAHVAAAFLPETMQAASPTPPPAPPQPSPLPSPPPPRDAAELQAQQQQRTVEETAGRAAGIQQQADKIAAGVPPPKPPEAPAPKGMESGAITQDTVDRAVGIITKLPPAEQPKGILEVVGNLAKRMLGMRTVIAPDGKVVNVDSPKAAQNEAIKIVNGEMDRQKEQATTKAKVITDRAKEKAKAHQDTLKQRQKDAETAQKEREAAITTGTEKETPVHIPDNRATQVARQVLRATPKHATAKHMDNAVRNSAAVTATVRKALIEEEIQRRANRQEDQAQAAMTGRNVPPEHTREALQGWADQLARGEHPYMHVPLGVNFVPERIPHMTRTKVDRAGKFGGTYYHVPEIDAADIRNAARDKTDPQAALDALEEKWDEETNPLGFTPVAETKPAAAETPAPKTETKPLRTFAEERTLYREAAAAAEARGVDQEDTEEWGTAIAEEEKRILAEREKPKPETPKPPTEPPASNKSTSGGPAPLPRDLAGSKPRYGYGEKNFELEFADPRDLAVYTLTQKTANKRHDDFLKYYESQFPGRTKDERDDHASVVRQYIKEIAAEPMNLPSDGPIKVPSLAEGKKPATKPVTPQVAPIKGVTPLGAKPAEEPRYYLKPATQKDVAKGSSPDGVSIIVDRQTGNLVAIGDTANMQASADEYNGGPKRPERVKPVAVEPEYTVTKANIIPTRGGYVAVPEEPDEKQPWEMTPQEYRAAFPEPVKFPAYLNEIPEKIDEGADAAALVDEYDGKHLKAMAFLLNVPTYGNKAQVAQRIIDTWKLRGVLSEQTVETLKENYKADQLREMIRQIGGWLGGNKENNAGALIHWRNEARKHATDRLTEHAHFREVEKAFAEGKPVSRANIDHYGLEAKPETAEPVETAALEKERTDNAAKLKELRDQEEAIIGKGVDDGQITGPDSLENLPALAEVNAQKRALGKRQQEIRQELWQRELAEVKFTEEEYQKFIAPFADAEKNLGKDNETSIERRIRLFSSDNNKKSVAMAQRAKREGLLKPANDHEWMQPDYIVTADPTPESMAKLIERYRREWRQKKDSIVKAKDAYEAAKATAPETKRTEMLRKTMESVKRWEYMTRRNSEQWAAEYERVTGKAYEGKAEVPVGPREEKAVAAAEATEPEAPTFKAGDKVTFTDFAGKEREGTILEAQPKRAIIKASNGDRIPVPLDKIKAQPVAEVGQSADNSSPEIEHESVQESEDAAGRPAAAGPGRKISDTPGTSGRPLGAELPGPLPGATVEGNTPASITARGRGDDLEPAPEREGGTEPRPSAGTGVSPVAAPAGSRPKKPKRVKNSDWYTHPDDFSVDAGNVQRLEWNITALKAVKKSEAGERLTAEDYEAMAHWVGWGALQDVFDPSRLYYGSAERKRYEEANEVLKELLTEEQFSAARRSTVAAHYTSPDVVRWMWSAVKKMGFDGGNILEPSVGSGNFLGMMPQTIRADSDLIGSELDPITAKIAKLLYPSANLWNKDFVNVTIPDNSLDLAIGNPPFGEAIYDPKYPDLNARIHDYFIIKSLDKLRPGGIMAFITSDGTLDKQNSRLRELMGDRADLVEAFRLPSNTFEKNAGTQVITDVLFFRKRLPGEAKGGEAFEKLGEIEAPWDESYQRQGRRGNAKHAINEYYVNHPDHILGKLEIGHGRYEAESLMVRAKQGVDFKEVLKTALKKIQPGAYVPTQRQRLTNVDEPQVYAPDTLEEGNFTVDDKGAVKQRVNGVLVNVEARLDKPPILARIRKLVKLREAYFALHQTMHTQPNTPEGDAVCKVERAKLKKLYDAYLHTEGYIHGKETRKAFEDDPHYTRLLALEDFNKATKIGTPADIFRERTIFAPDHTADILSDNPEDALKQLFGLRGFPDMDYYAEATGKTAEEVAEPLIEKGLIFKNPENGKYESAALYLSGNVRQKLKDAQAAVDQGMDQYEPNIAALKPVIPTDIPIKSDNPDPEARAQEQIAIRLGSPWITPEVLTDFIEEVFESPSGTVRYAGGRWTVEKVARTANITNDYAGGGFDGDELLEKALNLSTPKCYVEVENDLTAAGNVSYKTVLDADSTLAAEAAQEKIRDKFADWLRIHPKWAKLMQESYNFHMNATVDYQPDGSHLTFPGMNKSVLRNNDLDPHQKDAVWRAIEQGRELIAHVVGAGKTFEMIAAVMESRRLGLVRKAMIAVPNHLVEQWGADFAKLYPGARILVPTKKEYDAENRQKLMSRIATSNWDAVIIPHSQFNLLDVKAERMEKTIQRSLDELEQALAGAEMADAGDHHSSSRRGGGKKQKSRTVKQLEKALANKRAQLAELADLRGDKAIKFEDLGVDMLMVDEAHLYKNLEFYTKMDRISGLQQSNAKSAVRLKAKVDYLLETQAGRGVVFATGTPVQNTMAELYHMMRYVAPDVLASAGIKYFDDWAANFGEIITAMELSADGVSYKARQKFARFTNMPDLMKMFRSFADIKTASDLNLPTPELEGGKPIAVEIPSNEIIKPMIDNCVERAERIRAGDVKDPRIDNMLWVTGDGRKIALDPRLIDPTLPDHPQSKINKVAENVIKEWKEGNTEALTQLVFIDNYQHFKVTPKMKDGQPVFLKGKLDRDGKPVPAYDRVVDFDLVKDLIEKLVAAGIPREQIANIHDAKTDLAKQVMFDGMNAGTKRILIGSTAKMGAGMNVQRRLKCLHDVDSPWRPGDLEQRHGRMMRQGNINESVRNYHYVTLGSFDAYMLQTLQAKAEFIAQILSGRFEGRTVSDAANSLVLTLEELKAIASGNPDVKLQMELTAQAMKLLSQKRSHDGQRRINASDLEAKQRSATQNEEEAKRLTVAQATWNTAKDAAGGFTGEFDGKTYTKFGEMEAAMAAAPVPKSNFVIKVNGLDLYVSVANPNGEPDLSYAVTANGTPISAREQPQWSEVGKWTSALAAVAQMESGKKTKEIDANREKWAKFTQEEKDKVLADPRKLSSILASIQGNVNYWGHKIRLATDAAENENKDIARLEALVNNPQPFPKQAELDRIASELTAVNKRLQIDTVKGKDDEQKVAADTSDDNDDDADEGEEPSAVGGPIAVNGTPAPSTGQKFTYTNARTEKKSVAYRTDTPGLIIQQNDTKRDSGKVYRDFALIHESSGIVLKHSIASQNLAQSIGNRVKEVGIDFTVADDRDVSNQLGKLTKEKRELLNQILTANPKPPNDAAVSFMGSAFAEQALKAAGRYAVKAAHATWAELTRAARRPGASAKSMGREFVAALYPAALASTKARDIMGKATGEPAMRIFEAGQFLEGVKKMFAAMSPDEQVDFVDRWQHGEPQPTPDLESAQQFMQTILEQQREREQEAINLGRRGPEITLKDKENYFPNRYKVAPGQERVLTEDEQIQRLGIVSRRPFEGSKTFMKQQRYTLKDAIAEGAVPAGDPVDMLMRRLQEGAKFVAARTAWNNFKDANLAIFLKVGHKIPQGYSYVDDKSANVWRIIQSTEETPMGELRTFPIETGRWVMQDDAARLLNNYLSIDHIRGSEIGSAFVKLKNFTTEARLAISAFHWAYITVENMASGINIGLDLLYNQGWRGSDPTKISAGFAELGRAMVAPYTAIKRGGQVIQYARNPEEFMASPEGANFIERYPEFPRLMQLLFAGGLRWNIADTFRASFGDHCLDAWKKGELGKGLGKFLPWLSHAIMKPLFEHYIPRSKWAFAVELLSNKLAQNSQAIAEGSKTEEQIAREVAETTDNRFGELNWDSLYLNNNLRTTMQFFFRSATWKLGSWRGLAQAGHETFTSAAFDDKMLEKLEAQGRQLNWAQRSMARMPQLGVNAGWIVSMGLFVATMGSVITLGATHKFPWQWAKESDNGLPYAANSALEAMHPRTGELDEHGMPIRWSFPTGLKDYEHGFEHPKQYVKGSISDVVMNGWATLSNEDAFGNYVYNPTDHLYQQMGQGLLYNIKGDFIPMSASNWAREWGPQDATSKVLRATGMIGGAPKFLDRSAGLREAMALQRKEARTPEQEQEWMYRKSQPLTAKQEMKAQKHAGESYLEKLVKQMSYTDAMRVYEKASPEEKLKLQGIIDAKQRLQDLKEMQAF